MLSSPACCSRTSSSFDPCKLATLGKAHVYLWPYPWRGVQMPSQRLVSVHACRDLNGKCDLPCGCQQHVRWLTWNLRPLITATLSMHNCSTGTVDMRLLHIT